MRATIYSFGASAALVSCLLLFLPAHASKRIAPVAINVQVMQVATKDLPKQISSLGSLVAPDSVTLSADSSGRIKQINFKNGQTVGKGMPVLQLDDTSAEVDYQKAVAQLNTDSRMLARQLQAAETLSQQAIDSQKAVVEADKADVKSKQAILNQMSVEAPISGVLGNFQVNAGDYLTAGSPIVTLVNTKLLRVDYNISSDNLKSIKRGQAVILSVNSYPDKKFMGSVTYISPSLDPTTRTVAVQALVPNPKGLLRPGMFAHIEQNISMQKNALVIPQLSVIAGVKGYSVFRVINGKASVQNIQLGARFGNSVVVESGLKVGDSVIVSGQDKVQDGSPVNIIPGQPAALKPLPAPAQIAVSNSTTLSSTANTKQPLPNIDAKTPKSSAK
jgi:membrane fusion protein (multidrug efflux system)